VNSACFRASTPWFPYIAGKWPQPQYSSSIENEGIVLNFGDHPGTMAYGTEVFNAGNPLAWPSFATSENVERLPPTAISLTSDPSTSSCSKRSYFIFRTHL
jgi:acetyl esterase